MRTSRELFFEHLAQTSTVPPALEIRSGEGCYLTDKQGKKYLDLISGISVSSIGHNHPAIVSAIKKQVDLGLHFMVYGEFILEPQVKLAEFLSTLLPENLSTTYFVNSGSEAVEGALKLSKRYTARTEIISFTESYHGSTHGALSVTGNENLKNAFRPLLPDVKILPFNNSEALKNISSRTACVIAETIQGEAGAIVPDKSFMTALRKRCNETGALLILDEIQVGCGGMPLAAFISSKEIMSVLSHNPALGHITTFGGHPVCCAASYAMLDTIVKGKFVDSAMVYEQIFRKNLLNSSIKNISGKGLFLALQFENDELCKKIIDQCIKNGVIVDSFLFAAECMRIAPPLNITEKEIISSCKIINDSIEQIKN